MDKATYKSRYNNSSTGYFKDQTTQARIPSQERDLVEKTADNTLFFDDNFSDDADTSTQSIIKTVSERVSHKLTEIQEADTSGSTIALDLEDGKIKSYTPSANIGGNKTITIANATNAVKVILFLNFTASYTLTFPANMKRQSFASDWASNVWTAPGSGLYRVEMTYDGTDWYVDIYGDYV